MEPARGEEDEASYTNYLRGLSLYYGDNGTRQNYPEALVQFLAAAQDGNASAMNFLGYMYEHGEGGEKDMEKALHYYHKAAEKGNSSAANNLGYAYQHGEGVQKDLSKALKFYTASMKAGSVSAMNNLAYMYEHGEGVKQDHKKAFELYELSASQGNASAMCGLAAMYECAKGTAKNLDKAVHWYEEAVKQGNTVAMCNLAMLYENGIGVEKSVGRSLELFKVAAEAGDPSGLHNLAYAYQHGEGTPVDCKKALELYAEAARMGHSGAMNSLGYMLQHGKGTQQDSKKARLHYEEASKLGNSTAINNLGFMYEYGDGVDQDVEKAVEYYRKAAAMNDAHGLNNLGFMYQYGLEVEKDRVEAIRLFREAAKLGNPSAMTNLGFVLQTMSTEARFGDKVKKEKQARETKKSEKKKNKEEGNKEKQKEGEKKQKRDSFGPSDYYSLYSMGREELMEEAVKLYRKAERKDCPSALYHLALAYQYSWGVRAKDQKLARDYLQRASEKDHSFSKIYYGFLLYHGTIHGVREDPALAHSLLSSAVERWLAVYRLVFQAQMDNPKAMTTVAMLLHLGYGLPQNSSVALLLLKESARLGFLPSRDIAAVVRSHLSRVAAEYCEAVSVETPRGTEGRASLSLKHQKALLLTKCSALRAKQQKAMIQLSLSLAPSSGVAKKMEKQKGDQVGGNGKARKEVMNALVEEQGLSPCIAARHKSTIAVLKSQVQQLVEEKQRLRSALEESNRCKAELQEEVDQLSGLRLEGVSKAGLLGLAARIKDAQLAVQAKIAYQELTASQQCAICHDRKRQKAFSPCGHFVCCSTCGDRVDLCPICRAPIESRLKIYE